VTAVGIDACKTGWIAVALPKDGAVDAHFLRAIKDLAVAVADASAIAVDIPIGLPDTGRRRADVEAKALLGPRRNSVFFTPVRLALEAPTHGTATALSLQLTGSGMSQQSYALASKIFEVEDWLPTAPCKVWEIHPEVSFAVLIGSPAKAPKKTWAGMIERRDALAAAGIPVDRLRGLAASRAAVDDMLDAAAAAWTATRLLQGTARPVPDPPEVDSSGRRIAIWA
jgi:predicted RNase H-like nuclease